MALPKMNTPYDLNVRSVESLDYLHKLGWDGACLVQPYDKKGLKKTTSKELDLLTAAEITGDIRKNARRALDHVDLVFAAGNAREASECWEVDAIYACRDIDNVVARFMRERDIALMIDFSELLDARSKSKVIRVISKNVLLARKYKIPIVMASGAITRFGIRSPRDLACVATLFGLRVTEVKRTVVDNPQQLVRKARDRKDPNVILKGLRVVSWGAQRPQTKKYWGWY